MLRVPRAPGPITLDGDTDDPGWVLPPGPARTGAFLFAQEGLTSPYSEARLVWAGDYLYMALFASDEDIESHADQPDVPIGQEDGIRIVFVQPDADYAIEVSPTGAIADSIRRSGGTWDLTWNSGSHLSKEVDGTINKPTDLDEEWAVELAVPLASIGMKGVAGDNVGLSFARCDTPKESRRVCESWGADDGAHHGQGRIVLSE